MNILKFFSILFISIIIFSCNEENTSMDGENMDDKETLSTDLINNPETASNANENNVNEADLPIMTFNEEEFNFGQINEGDVVTHNFAFTNTGHNDLIISNAKASCGCTIPYYPKEPIASGATDTIKVQFDSKGKSGQTTKSITITTNSIPNNQVIYIKGEIIKDESI